MADSVIIISYQHKIETGDRPTLVNGKLNFSMVKEYKRLDSFSVKKLAGTITQPFKDSKIRESACWNPHHSIAFFKKKKISFITLCFECENIDISNDINIPGNAFDKFTWKKLFNFFKTQGFKYALDRL